MVSANTKPLSEFKTGEFVQIEKIQLEGTMKRRLLDLGFIPGATIKVLQRSPLGSGRLSSKQHNYRTTQGRKFPYFRGINRR